MVRGSRSDHAAANRIVARGVLGEFLHIQPSEVDSMTEEEIAGYLTYVQESQKMKNRRPPKR